MQGDLISRSKVEKVIKEFNKRRVDRIPPNLSQEQHCNICDTILDENVELLDAIYALPTAFDVDAVMDCWIPCIQQMPPQPKENPVFQNQPLELYLVTERDADYPRRVFWNGEFFTDGWEKADVIAWQPLPEVFKL